MLHAVVSDLTTVPEAFRPAYVEENGKFRLNVTASEGFALENTTGLKNALAAERTLKDRAESSLAAFKDIDPNTARTAIAAISKYGDITPEKAAELKAEVDRLTAIDPTKEADKLVGAKVDAATSALKTEFSTKEGQWQGQIEALQGANTGLKDQLRTLLVSNTIKAQLAELKPVEGAADLLEMLAEKSIKTVEKDGKFVVEVLDEAGNARVKLDGTTLVPFTVADLMAEIKDQKPAFFMAEDKGGVGIQPGRPAPRSTQVNPWAKETFNFTEQMKLEKTNPTLARQLAAQAGVAL